MECPICHFTANNFKEINSVCRLTGIQIYRFICPCCDIIFGPLNLIEMSPDNLFLEYKAIFDSGYKDVDNTMSEINTFNYLNPIVGAHYLNWGSGSTSSTSKVLKGKGYTLFAYDPFNPLSAGNDLYISNVNNMKFDGIMSHNLLEHLQNPVNTLIQMKSLLKNHACKMVHSTPCYRYEYEWTKFHLFFFVGKSLDIICKLTGLSYSKTNNSDIIIFTM